MQIFVYGPWNPFKILGLYLFVYYIGKKDTKDALHFGCCLGIQNITRINIVNMAQALDLIISLTRLSVP